MLVYEQKPICLSLLLAAGLFFPAVENQGCSFGTTDKNSSRVSNEKVLRQMSSLKRIYKVKYSDVVVIV